MMIIWCNSNWWRTEDLRIYILQRAQHGKNALGIFLITRSSLSIGYISHIILHGRHVFFFIFLRKLSAFTWAIRLSQCKYFMSMYVSIADTKRLLFLAILMKIIYSYRFIALITHNVCTCRNCRSQWIIINTHKICDVRAMANKSQQTYIRCTRIILLFDVNESVHIWVWQSISFICKWHFSANCVDTYVCITCDRCKQMIDIWICIEILWIAGFQ